MRRNDEAEEKIEHVYFRPPSDASNGEVKYFRSHQVLDLLKDITKTWRGMDDVLRMWDVYFTCLDLQEDLTAEGATISSVEELETEAKKRRPAVAHY